MGDARPPRAAHPRAGLPAVLGRRAAAAHPRRRGRLARCSTRCCGAASERGREELNGARERVGLPPLEHAPRRDLARSWRWSRRSPSSSTRARARTPWARVTGPLLWERPFGEVELPPGDEPLVLVAPRTSQDPRAADAARGAARAWRTSRCGCWPRPTGAAARAPAACRRTRAWSTGSPTRETMPRCAAVVCHAGHGTVARALACGVPVVALPGRGRHGRERGAGGVGGRGRVAAAAAGDAARDPAGGAARVLREPWFGAVAGRMAVGGAPPRRRAGRGGAQGGIG